METKQIKPDTKSSRPGIGIGTTILSKEGKILIGKRIKSGLYGFPGGHLERYETWGECASRELKEETDLDIPKENFRFFVSNNIIDKENDYHYMDINLVAWYPEGQVVKNTEPDKLLE